MRECLQDRRLQWFGHLAGMEESVWSNKCGNIKVTSNFVRGRPRKEWNKVIKSDLKERKVSKDINSGLKTEMLGSLS